MPPDLATTVDTAQANPVVTGLSAGLGIGVVMLFAGMIILMVVMNWKIVSKAGYSGWMSLLAYIPFVNLIAMILFAFADWPVCKKVRELEARK